MVTGLTQIYNIGFVKNFCAESGTKPSLYDLFIAAFIQFHTITAATYRRILPGGEAIGAPVMQLHQPKCLIPHGS